MENLAIFTHYPACKSWVLVQFKTISGDHLEEFSSTAVINRLGNAPEHKISILASSYGPLIRIDKFDSNPERYIEQLKEKGCPVLQLRST